MKYRMAYMPSRLYGTKTGNMIVGAVEAEYL